MKPFAVRATQGQRPNPLGLKRLPAYRDLWLLRVILAVRCRLKGKGSRRWNCRGVLAVPFLALRKVNFETVEACKVPCRTGEGHAHFLVDRPNVPVYL